MGSDEKDEDLIIRLAKKVRSELMGTSQEFQCLVFEALVKLYFPK